MIIPQSSCSSKHDDAISMDGFYFDTVCNISIYQMADMSRENALKVISEAFEECDRYEHLFSKTLEGTEVYRINHSSGEYIECSNDTVDIIRTGLYWSEFSDGVFDITVGKVSDLWDFHRETAPRIPDADVISDTVGHVGYEAVEISGNSVRLTDPEAEIDLGGIAKGYIADKLCLFLKEKGVTSALISLGGNVSSVGDKNGKPFKVGLKKPFADASSICAVTPSTDSTVVSSGIYERYFEIDGVIYHHILDPDTGMPADTDIYGVTVTSDNTHSADCDALATICIILGREKALDLIESLDGFEAYIIDSQNGSFRTSGFITAD